MNASDLEFQRATEIVNSSYGKFLAYRGDHITNGIKARGEFHESRLTPITARLTERHGLIPRTLVDIGAHIGTNILYAHNSSLFQKFIAIEPCPTTFKILHHNTVKHLNPDQITLHNAAVGSHDGLIELELNGNGNTGDTRVRNPSAPNGLDNEHARQTVEVPIHKPGKFLSNINEMETLFCIDAQGSEGLIAEGFQMDNIKPNFIIIEFWPYALDRLGCKGQFMNFLYDFDFYDVNTLQPLRLSQIQACGAKSHSEQMDILLVRRRTNKHFPRQHSSNPDKSNRVRRPGRSANEASSHPLTRGQNRRGLF